VCTVGVGLDVADDDEIILHDAFNRTWYIFIFRNFHYNEITYDSPNTKFNEIQNVKINFSFHSKKSLKVV